MVGAAVAIAIASAAEIIPELQNAFLMLLSLVF
jgi:hypothetical protein